MKRNLFFHERPVERYFYLRRPDIQPYRLAL